MTCSGAMTGRCQRGEAREYHVATKRLWMCDICFGVAEAHGMGPVSTEPAWVRLAREKRLAPKVFA